MWCCGCVRLRLFDIYFGLRDLGGKLSDTRGRVLYSVVASGCFLINVAGRGCDWRHLRSVIRAGENSTLAPTGGGIFDLANPQQHPRLSSVTPPRLIEG
jgi:hypothetical protein